jgi:NAD(P)H-dependent FMN reductase
MNTSEGFQHWYDIVNDFDVLMLVTPTVNAIYA